MVAIDTENRLTALTDVRLQYPDNLEFLIIRHRLSVDRARLRGLYYTIITKFYYNTCNRH